MIEIIDIGASPFEEVAPYERMVSLGLAHVTGFEPDPTAFEALRPDTYRAYLPSAIGDGEKHRFYRYRASGFNSLLPLRDDVGTIFPEAKEWMEPVGTETINTERLDDLRLPCDFLKMDCQGSELMVLQNAEQTLHDCVLVQLEICFKVLYVNQPTLGDLDRELQRQGFEPRNMLSSHIASDGAVVDADFLYIRRELTEEQGRRVERILEHCYPKCRR